VLGVLQTGDISSHRFETALEFAMSVINDTAADMNDKIRLAIAAMPFQHPKLAEQSAGKKVEAAAAAGRAASGRYATARPPKLVVNNGANQ
jgi:phage-related minor tail protein